MIVMLEPTPTSTLLHVIYGIESEAVTRMRGSFNLDLTPFLSQVDKEKPVIMSFRQVDSEQDTLELLQTVNAIPPFMPNVIAITPNMAHAKKCACKRTAPAAPGFNVGVGKCEFCGQATDVIVVGGAKPICQACLKIQQGLTEGKK